MYKNIFIVLKFIGKIMYRKNVDLEEDFQIQLEVELVLIVYIRKWDLSK